MERTASFIKEIST